MRSTFKVLFYLKRNAPTVCLSNDVPIETLSKAQQGVLFVTQKAASYSPHLALTGSNHPPKSGDFRKEDSFIIVLDRTPKLMEQYKTENTQLEKYLPTLREIVGGEWKKEEKLEQLKFDVTLNNIDK